MQPVDHAGATSERAVRDVLRPERMQSSTALQEPSLRAAPPLRRTGAGATR